MIQPNENHQMNAQELIQWKDDPNAFTAISNGSIVVSVDGNTVADALTAWKYISGDNLPLENGKLSTVASPRPNNTFNCFLSVDDYGQQTSVQASVGVSESYTSVKFNPQKGKVYIHSATIKTENAKDGDLVVGQICMDVNGQPVVLREYVRVIAEIFNDQPRDFYSEDISELPTGTYLRIGAINNSNTDWSFYIFLKVYREG